MSELDAFRLGVEELIDYEKWWRDNQPFLLTHGYQLRPMFRPGWTPSWLGTQRNPLEYEDSLCSNHPDTMDATRVTDGKRLCLKRVAKDSSEADIAQYLCLPQLRNDSRNHAVPIIDFLVGDTQYDFLVMPLLRRFYTPPFVFVEEVTDFVRQTLEGLMFLHGAGIAHRDCSDLNIMFDAQAMYPNGFHPSNPVRNLESRTFAPHLNRIDVLPSVIYYFTDFGISTHFTDPSVVPRLVIGQRCQDKEVPELSDLVPYDPFKTDVFILGNVYKRTFTDVYSNLQFLMPLVTSMTKNNPRDRPSSEGALVLYNKLLSKESGLSLRWMLLQHDLSAPDRRRLAIRSLVHLMRRSLKTLLKSPHYLFVPIVFSTLALYIRIQNYLRRRAL